MNKTNIEYADMTWDPVVVCKHGCEYCYAKRIAKRFGGYDISDGTIITHCFGFEPTRFRYRLEEPQHIKESKNIFVCSMADLFGDWVPNEWIQSVFDACEKAPQHRYLFLTKNPNRYVSLAKNGMLPSDKNFWYGTTVTNPDTDFYFSSTRNTFLSIEPLLEPFGTAEDNSYPPGWIIIGAMSGAKSKQHQLKREWINEIEEVARNWHTPIFMKDSLIPIVGEENMRREFPWETER